MSELDDAKAAALAEINERRRTDGAAIDTHVAGSRAIVGDRVEALRELIHPPQAPPALDDFPPLDEAAHFDQRIDTQA